jgi:hypothetical protein
MLTFTEWLESKQWALYDPFTDEYTTDQDAPHMAPIPDQSQVDLIISRAVSIIQNELWQNELAHDWHQLGEIRYKDFGGRDVESQVLLEIRPRTELGPGQKYAIDGSAVREGPMKGQILLKLFLGLGVRRRNAVFPDENRRVYTKSAQEQLEDDIRRAEQEQAIFERQWSEFVDELVPVVKAEFIQVMIHEMGHHQRPHTMSNREGRLNKVAGNSQYHTDLPDEWDTETSKMVILYHRLPPEQKAGLTYRQLIGMNDFAKTFLKSHKTFKRTVGILRRKGVALKG